jgi:hypothetical protein
LRVAIPLHAVAALAAPRQKDQIELSRLVAEIYLALAYRALGNEDESLKARDRAWDLIVRMEKSTPHNNEGLSMWATKYGVHVGKRKLALFFDGFSGPAEPAAKSP